MIGKIAIFCKNFLDWFKSERCFLYPFIKAFPFANNLLLVTLALCFATFNIIYFALSLQIKVNILVITLVLALLSSAFVAGFCQIIKDTVNANEEDKDVHRLDIKHAFVSFYSGVGKNYLSFLCGFILFFSIIILSMMASLLLATKYICPLSSIGLDLDSLQLVLSNQNAMLEFASQMTKSQVIKMLELFYITNVITPGIIGFLLMLWIPEFVYTGKNVVVALFTSIKKLFLDFWNVICIYLVIAFGHMLIALVFGLFPQMSLISYIGSLVFIYWLIYNIFVLFIYYRKKWCVEQTVIPAEKPAEEQE